MNAKIISSGHYLPKGTLTNDDLSKVVDTSDEWIRSRTGIGSRHMATDENTSDLAYIAAVDALKKASLDPKDLDFIIVATITPDYVFPSVAAMLQKRLGMRDVFALDINAACTGFIYALETALGLFATGRYQKGLVIGAETLTKIVDFTDRNTCVLFGDGAGAFVLGAASHPHFIAVDIHAAGEVDALALESYPLKDDLKTKTTAWPFLSMNGKEVFRFAVDAVPKVIQSLLEKSGKTVDDIGAFVLHQANQRILDKAAKDFGIPYDKLVSTLEYTGNTSSASVPIAFEKALEAKMIKRGDLVIMVGFGGGLTWGGVLVEY